MSINETKNVYVELHSILNVEDLNLQLEQVLDIQTNSLSYNQNVK